MTKHLLTLSLLFAAAIANAELKRFDEVLSKATPQEKSDLGNLLKQIRMVPAKDPKTGQDAFKVVAVEKGSVYDREGIKVGDLLAGPNGKVKKIEK